MEGDSVHATIETSTKKLEIYSPSDWITAIKNAKRVDPRYAVKEIKSEMILTFKEFANENDNANEISYMLKTSNMKKNLNYEMSLDVQYEILFIITPYIRMLDSDWLIAVIFFYKFRPCIVNL